MSQPIPLTPEIEQYITNNCNIRTTRQMATELGVSYSTVQRFIARIGIPNRTAMRRAEAAWNKEQVETFKRLYPTIADAVLAEQFGVCIDSVRNIARRMGIEKDEDYMKEVQLEHQRAATEASLRLTAEDIQARNAKISAIKKEAFRKDRMRFFWDLPTKLRPKYGHNKREAGSRYILRRRGYVCEDGAKDMYRVVGVTRVDPRLEATYAKKYRFTYSDIVVN